MTSCANCGRELASARFCPECGHPVGEPAPPPGPTTLEQTAERSAVPADDWRSTTAERPAVRAPLPPPPSGHDQPRYPLFADQVAPAATPTGGGRPRMLDHGWLPWAVAALALVLVAGLGFLLLGGGDDEPAVAGRPTRTSGSATDPDRDSANQEPGAPQDVAHLATASAPRTAPPNQDLDGNQVRYEARNLLDGVDETCWRMPGDGTGQEITIRLDQPTTLRKVGLINGYAKVATDGAGRTLDWYRGDRRIRRVEWVFDDGTTIGQRFTDTSDMQTMDIDPVTTSTVLIRLVEVTRPGHGRAARNYTPISDVTLVGTPG